MGKPIITLKNVNKDYHIYTSNRQRFAREILGRDSGETHRVLKNINLEVQEGEKIALLGDMGSGRSTLINLLAGLIYPTEGVVSVRKKTLLIRSLKVGFINELPGRENIRIQGSMLGWSRKQIADKEQGIIEFAQLENIIDYPVNTYTSIDANRLGLAIQTAGGSDIILFDAPFTKGDLIFREKSIRRLRELCDAGTGTLVIVTNDIRLARELCDRAILLDRGKLVRQGTVDSVFKHYKKRRKKRESRESKSIGIPIADEEFTYSDSDEFS